MGYDRRDCLGAVAAALAGVAGCVGGGGDRTPTDGGELATDPRSETPTGTPTSTPDDGATTRAGTATGTPTGGRLVLERIDDTPTVPLTVYSEGLADILRDAATTDGVVRATATTNPYNPQPVLPSFETVEIVDETGDAGGVYTLDAEAGTRYRMGLRAEEAPDANESATDVASLSGERRALVESAVTDDRHPGVLPETGLGEWAREHVFGHYFDYEGTRYRITEVHATDAAFFSTTAWYVVSLEPTDGDPGDAVTLRLREIPAVVRTLLDPVVDWEYRRPPERVTREYERTREALRTFAAETDGLLTHTGAMTLAFER